MNKTLLALVVIFSLGFGGWYLYNNKSEVPAPSETKESDLVLSASFTCDDDSSFTATFAKEDAVEISSNSSASYSLPKVAGDGQRFENNQYVYVFAGEEANVTTKATGKTAICTQPFDPENAPVNFGDAGEGGSVKQDMILIVSESILGKWESTEDAKFVREFKEDGTVTDYYNEEAVDSGTWQIFSSESSLSVPFTAEANAAYLRIVMSGSQKETLHFKISKLTPEALELIYMDRGGVLTFTSIQ